MFRDPISVSLQLPIPEEDSFEFISYVVLYNLALAYHLKAAFETNHTLQRSILRKALTLYEHAHHVLKNQDFDLTLTHTMALTCNLGHIHHLLGDSHKAKLCFQHLLSTLLYVVDSGEALKINGGKLDGFFRNVMPLVSRTPSAPAA